MGGMRGGPGRGGGKMGSLRGKMALGGGPRGPSGGKFAAGLRRSAPPPRGQPGGGGLFRGIGRRPPAPVGGRFGPMPPPLPGVRRGRGCLGCSLPFFGALAGVLLAAAALL